MAPDTAPGGDQDRITATAAPCRHPAWWAMTYKRPTKHGRHVLVDRLVCVECSEVRRVP